MKVTAAVAIAALVVGCSSTSPSPSIAGLIAPPSVASSEHAAPSASAFASDRYRYVVVLPSGWLARPAESTWTSGVLGGRCPSDWDCFSDNADGVTLAAAALAVPADLTLNQWRLRIHVSTPDVCSDAGPHTDTTLDSEPGQAWASTCSSENLDVIKVVAIHRGQGYIVLFASPSSIGLEADRATFDAILATFRFAA